MLKKRIPTLLGIFLLLVGITAGVYLVELGPQSLTTRAGPEFTPSEVIFTNITDHSFTVSWFTEASALGFVRYGTRASSLDLSALDDRNKGEGGEQGYVTHHATLENLSPETTYFFEIVSGTGSTSFINNGQPYSATTAPSLSPSGSAADAAYGAVYYSDLTPAEDALVYVFLEGGSPLSSLVTSTGTWSVPLSSMRTTDLNTFLSFDSQKTTVTISAVGPDGSRATVNTTTANDAPVDDIVFGTASDLASQSQEGTESAKASQFSLTPFSETPMTQTNVSVKEPSEGEAVNTQQPEFRGAGPEGSTITIILESEEPIQATVRVSADGLWSWAPSVSLEPGDHQLTIRWLDENGITRSLTRHFIVYAQGESDLPAFEATPSATATPTPVELAAASPTSVPTTRPTATPTARPTLRLTTTPTPSLSPTPTLHLTPAPYATEPALPEPGSGMFSLILVIFGIFLTASGAFLFARRTSF